ncbi:MAG TPA: S9 family peptidase, partial [Nitrobacter sp.]|nr:S9 family peptidase [Nitrobacter sp.]
MISTPTPPKAERRPQSYTHHGIALTDDYAWLKDANWQQVLREPSLLASDIRAYLEAENAYSNALLAETEPLQKQLVAEMRGRIKEDDSTVPSPDGPFAYFTKYREGGQHRIIGRQPRDGGDTRFLIDGDALAAGKKFFQLGDARHSPDHRFEAWSVDDRGSEYFTIKIRDWDSGTDLADAIEETDGGVVWSADARAFYYVKLDDNHRPMQVYRHRLGTPQSD